MNDFFKNEKELVANAGRAYTKLQGYNSEQSLWTLLLQASDECAVPACGGSWYSNGRYEEIQTNKIPPANKLLTRGWNWIFNGIAACNEIIYETELDYSRNENIACFLLLPSHFLLGKRTFHN